ncbi:MAG: FtsW/RodA/SpoVE family cell cycle protein [Clostridiales bacterium]|nr:FtsW/RodA/SpoVE family cell cycle protein [Clostridiales bacterium]
MKVFSTTLREKLRKIDWIVLLCVMSISAISIITLASVRNDYGTDKLIVQLFATVLGVLCAIVISMIDYQFVVQKLSIPLFVMAVIALIITLIIGIGEGNKSWIRLPGIPLSIQPSEFTKIIFIITFARHIDLVKSNINHIKNLIPLLVHAGIITGLVLLQKDLGTVLVYCVIICAMLFSAGLSIWYFIGGIAFFVVLFPAIWEHLDTYQQQRILFGFRPELDPLNYGYQPLMSKSAIAAGGFFGSGYFGGTEYQSIPKAHTDFIFAVMAEKFGFLGALIFFILICTLVIRIIVIGRRARKQYGSYICVGVAAVLIAQTVENIGMCLAMLPVVGITLPFMSYGGSSVLSLYIMIGVVESIHTHKMNYFFEREKT